MKKNILVVDDDIDVATLIKSKLEEHRFGVLLADCGYDAIEVLKTNAIDLVVTDYTMKDGDGGCLAYFCEAQKVPCIIVSGYFSSGGLNSYVPAGTILLDKIKCLDDHSLLANIQSLLVKKSA